jgi:NADPH-dependent 2,4-dienoyl-CoA reductase/sulfur reductase-like enzyme
MKTLRGYTFTQFLLSFETITKLVLEKSGGGGGSRLPPSPCGYASAGSCHAIITTAPSPQSEICVLLTEIIIILAVKKHGEAAQVIVIGGGMAGLAACEHLVQSGLNVVLVEANNYLGNSIMS